jgi:hypothetical protein
MILNRTLRNHTLLAITLVGLTVMTSACGTSGSFVEGVSVTPSTQNGDQWVNLNVKLNTWSLTLPSVDLPIGGANEVGSLSLTGSPGSAVFEISANINALAQVQSGDGHLLPNGTAIPVAGAANVPVVEIELGGGILVYVSLSTSELMLGAAIPIAQFAQLPSFIPGLNYFPAFSIGKIQGVAGLYAGSENGIAFFVDSSSALPTPAAASDASATARIAMSAPSLKYVGVVPNRRTQTNVQNELYQLGEDRRGQPLTVGQ